MAALPGGVTIEAGPSFEEHVALIQQRHRLQERCDEEGVALRTLEGLVTWFTLHLQDAESNPQLAVLRTERERKRKEISTMVRITNHTLRKWNHTCIYNVMYMYMYIQEQQINDITGKLQGKFAKEDGPFVQALDRALESFNVSRQAYYGGTFIGNHVHRCLEV